MKKKQGFTLIELLAVIVILAVIALIVTPIIMGVINDAKKGAFKDSVYGIINAVELDYARNALNLEITYTVKNGKVSRTDPSPKDIDIKGKVEGTGKIVVSNKGKIYASIGNGAWCATKGESSAEVNLYKGECIVVPDPVPIG